MPPKPKITRDMVIDAAFEVARKLAWKTSMHGQYQRS